MDESDRELKVDEELKAKKIQEVLKCVEIGLKLLSMKNSPLNYPQIFTV